MLLRTPHPFERYLRWAESTYLTVYSMMDWKSTRATLGVSQRQSSRGLSAPGLQRPGLMESIINRAIATKQGIFPEAAREHQDLRHGCGADHGSRIRRERVAAAQYGLYPHPAPREGAATPEERQQGTRSLSKGDRAVVPSARKHFQELMPLRQAGHTVVRLHPFHATISALSTETGSPR